MTRNLSISSFSLSHFIWYLCTSLQVQVTSISILHVSRSAGRDDESSFRTMIKEREMVLHKRYTGKERERSNYPNALPHMNECGERKRRETCISITRNGKVVPFPVSAFSVLFICFHFLSSSIAILIPVFNTLDYYYTPSHPISFRFVCLCVFLFSVFPSFIWVERTFFSLFPFNHKGNEDRTREREKNVLLSKTFFLFLFPFFLNGRKWNVFLLHLSSPSWKTSKTSYLEFLLSTFLYVASLSCCALPSECFQLIGWSGCSLLICLRFPKMQFERMKGEKWKEEEREEHFV